MTSLRTLAQPLPFEVPTARLLWQAAVEIGDRQTLGASPPGERFLVPIVGGSFWGGPGRMKRCRARVLPGGADRQLLRPDGMKELDALYELQVDDGTVLTVRNRVTAGRVRCSRATRGRRSGSRRPPGPGAG
jgi:hypothetical protein